MFMIMKKRKNINLYPWGFPINRNFLRNLEIERLNFDFRHEKLKQTNFLRYITETMTKEKLFKNKTPQFIELIAFQTIFDVYRFIIHKYANRQHPNLLLKTLEKVGIKPTSSTFSIALSRFLSNFPSKLQISNKFTPVEILYNDKKHSIKRQLSEEILITRVMNENPATEHFINLHSDYNLIEDIDYVRIINILKHTLSENPIILPFQKPLLALLYEPIKASPYSLIGQLEYIKNKWLAYLPTSLIKEILLTKAIIEEEEKKRFNGGPGPIEVMEFKKIEKKESLKTHYDYPEYEAYTPDTDWMPNVVLIAKMAYVWLYQLSKQYGRAITRLDEIPDEELDKLAKWGFTGLWLIGIWERSPASQRIKHLCGNTDAAASAYSLYDYEIAKELGGWEALDTLRQKALKRGIRLACDIVPNHMGIVSKWIYEHPNWFIQCSQPPYPNYKFTGENLSIDPNFVIQIEDGYFTRTDAAVVFRFEDLRNGGIRYIYHGNDGTSTPWNDTAQLNYLLPEVREYVIKTIINVARHFSIIRFDAAMTLAKKHYQRLWFPLPGHGGGIPSRSLFSMNRKDFEAAMPKEFWREVVERINKEQPDTLLIAEAFWLMEGYFVRTLGMHRVYNSAFMNMLKMEENAKYRQTIKNILTFDPRILQRFVNFMNNPDEKTAIEQFGKGDKYFGVAVMLATMPGLPMFGHGQVEGYHEKYGMEYKKAYYDEKPDQYLIQEHEYKIFPLLRKRRLFSGSEHFYLFDFITDENHVNENVFAYSNRYKTERALVVYNNSFFKTSGHIFNSVPHAHKDMEGRDILLKKTLAQALELKNDEKIFYTFKDYRTGLEYIRNGKEIHEKGLYFELNGYQYYAFLDFREIFDEKNIYTEIYKKLKGQGVQSLEEEYKLVMYEHLHKTFEHIVETVFQSHWESKEKMLIAISNEFYSFFEKVNQLHFNYDPLLINPKNISALFDKLNELYAIIYKDMSQHLKDDKIDNEKTYYLFCLVSVIYAALTPFKTNENILSFIKTTKFDYVINKIFIKAIESEKINSLFKNSFIILLTTMKYMQKLNMEEPETMLTIIEEVFKDEDIKQALGGNLFEGVEWFNKELFELFIIILVAIKSLSCHIKKEVPISLIELSFNVALKSNYETKRLLKLINDEETKRSFKMLQLLV